MKAKLIYGLALPLALSGAAEAQSSNALDCGLIETAGGELDARLLVRRDPANPTRATDTIIIYTCWLASADRPNRECSLLFQTQIDELVAVQWVGPRRLIIETKALQAAAQHLQLSISTSSDSPAAYAQVIPEATYEPDRERGVAARLEITNQLCRLMRPPR